jgi:flagellar protein FliJ
MKRFKFRLERVLDYRKSLTEGEKAQFGLKVRELTKAEQNASELRGIRNQALVVRLESYEKGITSPEASNLHEHIKRIDETIEVAQKKVENAKQNVEVARVKLVERRRDQKAVELVKDRRFKAWQKDYYRDEGKTLDDIATIRHVHKSGEE